MRYKLSGTPSPPPQGNRNCFLEASLSGMGKWVNRYLPRKQRTQKICRRPFFRLQPLQPATIPLFTGHLDEVFVKIHGERSTCGAPWTRKARCWRPLEEERPQGRTCQLMKRYPRPDAIITDRLRSYRAALRELGGIGRLNNRRRIPTCRPAARTRNAPFQADAKPPEICRRPFFRLQPLQPAAIPLLTGQFQAQPRRCTCQVELTRGGLIPYRQRITDLLISSDSAFLENTAAQAGRAAPHPSPVNWAGCSGQLIPQLKPRRIPQKLWKGC